MENNTTTEYRVYLAATLLALSPLVGFSCGGLYTHQRRDYAIDPSILEELPERDPRGAWPREDLATSGVRFGSGDGARFLSDYIVVRPTSEGALDALLENYAFLEKRERVEFEGDTGSFLYPRGDLWVMPSGGIEEHEVDTLLEVVWSKVDPDDLESIPADPSQTGAVYDSEKGATLVRIARYLEFVDDRKVVSARPITVAVDHVSEREGETLSMAECPCGDFTADPVLHDARHAVSVTGGQVVDCSAETHIAGTNLLTVQRARVSASMDPEGAVQRPRLWFVPASSKPLVLPGLGSLSTEEDQVVEVSNFETWLPPGAHTTELQGPVSDGQSTCGWSASSEQSTIAYRNAGQWFWSDPDADETVSVLAYEHDGGICLYDLFCSGLDDDLVGWFTVQEAASYGVMSTVVLEGLQLDLATVPECGVEDCGLYAEDCGDDFVPNGPCDPYGEDTCKQGEEKCLDGKVVCVGGTRIGEVTEVCNGLDDDCIGGVDNVESIDQPCVGPGVIIIPEQDGFASRCEEGIFQCVEDTGTWSLQCVGDNVNPPVSQEGTVPEGEVEPIGCDIDAPIRWDDDCDGAVDEGCECTSGSPSRECGTDVGACSEGIQSCIEYTGQDQWSGCCIRDVCLDHSECIAGKCSDMSDCGPGTAGFQPVCPNGTECEATDAGLRCMSACDVSDCIPVVLTEQPCFQLLDGCDSSLIYQVGQELCIADEEGFALYGSQNYDEDCDGLINEGELGEERVNDCGHCLHSVPDEICNFYDDNCDQQIDENFDVGEFCETGLLGECAPGYLTCAPGGSDVECQSLQDPQAEVCDLLDNNCDGLVDEGLPAQNICGTCSPGGPTAGLPYGLMLESGNFSVQGGSTDIIYIDEPPVAHFANVVLVSDYYTDWDDDFSFVIDCIHEEAGLDHGPRQRCEIDAYLADENAIVAGKIFVLGTDEPGVISSTSWTETGNNCSLGSVIDGDSVTIIGASSYHSGDAGPDDELSFLVQTIPEPPDDKRIESCTSNCDSGSCWASGFAMSLNGLCAESYMLVDVTVLETPYVSPADPSWVNDATPITWAPGTEGEWSSLNVVPLLGVSSYETNTDHDISWYTECGPDDMTSYSCRINVTGGDDGASSIHVTGIFLALPEAVGDHGNVQ